MMKLLEIDSLRVQFASRNGSVEPINDVSCELKKGEILGIVGESGSGKSVTAQAIMGLLHFSGGAISAGTIRFCGEDLAKKSEKEMSLIRGRRIGFIPQNPMTSLDPVFCVGEQIVEGIMQHSNIPVSEARSLALKAMQQVRIPGVEQVFNQYPHELSGGLRQRIVIAMALALNPELIISDEPTTALDVTIQKQILHLMREMATDRNVGIVLITHDFGAVAEICDKVAVMYAGRVIEFGPVNDILKAPRHPYTKALLNSVPRLGMPRGSLRSIPGSVPGVSDFPTGCRFHPRCSVAEEICKQTIPKAVAINEFSTVACVRYKEDDRKCM